MDQSKWEYTRVEGPSAWYGAEMATRSDEWMYQLGADDLNELQGAINSVGDADTPILNVNKEAFPLAGLGTVMHRIQDDVVSGRGFTLIRGLPVEELTIEESAIAYFLIGSYFGWPIPQNAKGHVLGHVRDIGLDPTNPTHRLYGTTARHLYHTDSCDIVGLLCLQTAKSGGLSKIASSVTVYNEMVTSRPDLVQVLAEPFSVDRKGEIPQGKRPHYEMPIINPYGGYLTTTYNRDFITAAQRFDDVPRLTDQQVEAMDMVDEIADSDSVRIDMDFRPGDMQFIHNHQVLHSRTTYEDYPEPERKRHLLRLWLTPPNARPLAPVIAERFGNIEVGPTRGGIRTPGQVLSTPLKPE